MNEDWDGKKNRRAGDIALENRLTILSCGLESVQKKVELSDHELKADIRIMDEANREGMAAILEKIVQKEIECTVCQKDIATLQANVTWLDRWILALSSAFCAFFGWDFYSGIKK